MSEHTIVRATWNGVTIAESHDTVVVEGNHYFPRESLVAGVAVPSDTTSRCPWKGEASYLSLQAGGDVNADAAWYYPQPKEAASGIAGRVAFWRGVVVEEMRDPTAP